MDRHKFQIVIFIIFLSFAGGCLKPPALPRWDVSLTIPVFRRPIRLYEVLSRHENFLIQPDSSLLFKLSHNFGRGEVSEAFSVASVETSETVEPDEFRFSHLGNGRCGVGVDELIGISIPDSGVKLAVPAFEVAVDRGCVIEDVQFVEILEGVAITRLVNRTPLVINCVVNILGFTLNVEGLAPGEMRAERIDIGGVVVRNPTNLRLVVSSRGSGQDTVHILPEDSLIVDVEFESTRVGAGRLKISEARAEKVVDVNISAVRPLRIDSIVLDRGELVFTVRNRFLTPVNIEYEIRKLGVISSRVIEPNAALTLTFDLAGQGVDNQSKRGRAFEIRVRAGFDSQTGFVDLRKDDGVDITCAVLNARPRMVKGKFLCPVYVVSRVETIPYFVPFDIRGARFASAELLLEGENSIGFPGELLVTLQAIRNSKPIAVLDERIDLTPGSIYCPQEFDRRLRATELLNSAPDFIVCNYNVRLNGLGRYEEGEGISGEAVLNVPLRVAFVPDTVFFPGRKIELSAREKEAVSNHLVGGEAEVNVKSEMPFRVNGRLIIKRAPDDGSGVKVDSVVIPFVLPPGEVNNEGRSASGVDTIVRVQLDSNEVTLFRSRSLTANLALEFPATDTVVVCANDQIMVDVAVELRMRVDENLKW